MGEPALEASWTQADFMAAAIIWFAIRRSERSGFSRMISFRLALTAGVGMLLGCNSIFADDSVVKPASATPAAAAQENWSSFLPFMKEEALSRGYELPLPFGVGLVYNYLQRGIDVTDVRIGLGGGPPRSVSRFLDLGSESRVNAGLVKGDVWLLPFLNLYALVGYIDNESTSVGQVTIPGGPRQGPREFEVHIPTKIDGVVGGVGLTLAAGYKQFFFAGDVNYSQTDMGFDDRFRALIGSVRVGWHGKVCDVPVRLWVGGAYWDTANTASSTVDVAGVGRINFEADQGPRNPWNAMVGGSFVLGRRWDLFVEYGFNLDDVHIVATGVTFRF
jgi:hypothetical protein